MKKRYAIIVAGGKGLRMGWEIPKQFIVLGPEPILMHTIRCFHRFDAEMKIILVLPAEQQNYWKELCREYAFTLPHQIVDGGETRFHSVKNGLSAIQDPEGWVAIHDGVRPFVAKGVIEACFEQVQIAQAVIPVADVVDTLRQIGGGQSQTVDRKQYKLVQTPQVFDLNLLRTAYRQPYQETFTDDASVVEALGKQVNLIDGNRENIKITTPYDLLVGEALIKMND